MNQYIDIISRILDLCDTLQEGLKHIESKLMESRMDVTFEMMNDIILGIYNIDKSFATFRGELPVNQIDEYGKALSAAVSSLVSAYDANNENNALQLLQITVLPAFRQWKSELIRTLKPYTLS